MADGDSISDSKSQPPRSITFSKSKIPFIGAFIDYIETNFEYILSNTFSQTEKFNVNISKAHISSSFMTTVCLILGLIGNMKFEIVTIDETPLPNDLHFMLMSKVDNIYIDDIDQSRVMWCLEASDALLILISCILIWSSSKVHKLWHRYDLPVFKIDTCLFQRSPLSEYLYLPWMGATLRGLFLRQAPTAVALLYTMFAVNGSSCPFFVTSFSFLFLLEVRLWLEVTRLVRMRWERSQRVGVRQNPHYEVETLWNNEKVHSVEMHNFLY